MDDRFPDGSARPWRVSVRDALLQHATMVDRPSLIASIDSALNTRRMTTSELGALIQSLPKRLRGIKREVDGRSMSGTESKLRIACISIGLRVELQASIANVGFVDLLIDGWLIVEVDSRQFHDVPIQQHAGRVRDGNAVLGSFGHLRFDYQLVQFDIEWCLDVILARLKSGRRSVC
jgi:very-short-patch-repair endonuclease